MPKLVNRKPLDTKSGHIEILINNPLNRFGGNSGLSEAQKERFIARSYVKLAKDGVETVCYATENDNTRSIKSLAQAVINDGNYANEAQLAWLNKWAAAADWKV